VNGGISYNFRFEPAGENSFSIVMVAFDGQGTATAKSGIVISYIFQNAKFFLSLRKIE